MPLYINRFRRVRHADPNCRAIRASEDGLEETYGGQPVRPPARVVEIPDPTDRAETSSNPRLHLPLLLLRAGRTRILGILADRLRAQGSTRSVRGLDKCSGGDPQQALTIASWLRSGRGMSGDGRGVIEEASPEGYVIGELVATGPWGGDDED